MNPIRPESPRDRRRSPRLPLHYSVLVSWKDNGRDLRDTLVTIQISRFGCALYLQQPLPPGSSLELEFQGRQMAGQVVYHLKDASTELTEVGISFDQDGAPFWNVAF